MHAQKTGPLSLHTEISASHTKTHPKHFHSLFCLCNLLHSRRNTQPLPFICIPLSYHPVRSRRWFFGRSCRAHRSQPPATLCPSPPSLHTPTHTPSRPAAPLLLPQLINYSDFCQDTCMRAHTEPHIHTYSIHTHIHTHTQRESADAEGRAVGAWAALSSGLIGRRHQIRLLQCEAMPPFFKPPLIIQITPQCNRYGVQDVLTLLKEREGRRKSEQGRTGDICQMCVTGEGFLCCQSLEAIQTSKCNKYFEIWLLEKSTPANFSLYENKARRMAH